MEEKGIVGRECLPLELCFPLPRDHRLGAAGGGGALTLTTAEGPPPRQRLRRETTAGNNPFLLHVMVQYTSD